MKTRPLTILLVAALALTATVSSADRRFDPLSFEQAQQQCQIAFADIDPQLDFLCDRRRRLSRGTWELLLIERRIEKPAPGTEYTPRADVYLYNYDNDRLRHLVINLNTRRVESRDNLRGVQLPLTASETTRAAGLAFDDPQVRRDLDREYRAITGAELSDLGQLTIKAFVFHADSVPGRVNRRAAKCGVRRCAKLTVSTDGVALDSQPIVDLSGRRVVQAQLTDPDN